LEEEEGQAVWPKVKLLARSPHPEDFEKLKKYVLEAQRITLTLPIVRVAEKDGHLDVHYSSEEHADYHSHQDTAKANGNGNGSVKTRSNGKVNGHVECLEFNKGDKFILHLGQETDRSVNINRKESSYVKYSSVKHSQIAELISSVALATMVKHVAGLNNLRTAHDTPGALKKVKQFGGLQTTESYMTSDWSEFVPYPASKFGLFLLLHISIPLQLNILY
jgi:hypothetical protein